MRQHAQSNKNIICIGGGLSTHHGRNSPGRVFEWARKAVVANYVELITRATLQQQYQDYAHVLKSKAGSYSSEYIGTKEFKLYCEAIHTESTVDIGETLHPLAEALLRTANEAPAECMANVIKYHFDGRNVKFESAAHEALIHWNGPSSLQADLLIENSLNLYIEKDAWHFKRSLVVWKLTTWRVSAIVDRKQKKELRNGRIQY